MRTSTLITLLFSAVVAAPSGSPAQTSADATSASALPGRPGRSFHEVERFPAEAARQATAVDAAHFYAIDNRTISQHDKETGELVATWSAGLLDPIIHLNSGVVLDGVLYAAHSNYPGLPMVSSIETWDVDTMERIGSRDLGLFPGSATWVDRHDGAWWVGFANYAGRGGDPARGPDETTVVRYDNGWRETGRYRFPASIVGRFGEYSASGGAWGPDGYLYVTGHDAAEIYVLRVPERGSVLELVEIAAVAAEGQGIAWDRSRPGTLYTIVRATRAVVVSRMETR